MVYDHQYWNDWVMLFIIQYLVLCINLAYLARNNIHTLCKHYSYNSIQLVFQVFRSQLQTSAFRVIISVLRKSNKRPILANEKTAAGRKNIIIKSIPAAHYYRHNLTLCSPKCLTGALAKTLASSGPSNVTIR